MIINTKIANSVNKDIRGFFSSDTKIFMNKKLLKVGLPSFDNDHRMVSR